VIDEELGVAPTEDEYPYLIRRVLGEAYGLKAGEHLRINPVEGWVVDHYREATGGPLRGAAPPYSGSSDSLDLPDLLIYASQQCPGLATVRRSTPCAVVRRLTSGSRRIRRAR